MHARKGEACASSSTRAGASSAAASRLGGQVHPTGYHDTLALIRDGERGLEAAAAAAESSEPVTIDRLLAPLTSPGKIFGSGVNYASHGDEEPGFVFPDEKVIVGLHQARERDRRGRAPRS